MTHSPNVLLAGGQEETERADPRSLKSAPASTTSPRSRFWNLYCVDHIPMQVSLSSQVFSNASWNANNEAVSNFYRFDIIVVCVTCGWHWDDIRSLWVGTDLIDGTLTEDEIGARKVDWPNVHLHRTIVPPNVHTCTVMACIIIEHSITGLHLTITTIPFHLKKYTVKLFTEFSWVCTELPVLLKNMLQNRKGQWIFVGRLISCTQHGPDHTYTMKSLESLLSYITRPPFSSLHGNWCLEKM